MSAVIDCYCEAWSETDAARRSQLLAAVWAANATYTDPSVHAANAQELLTHFGHVQARRPGARVLRTSPVDCHHGLARFAWHVVLPDGSSAFEGLDLALLTADGARIERIIGFFGPLRVGAT